METARRTYCQLSKRMILNTNVLFMSVVMTRMTLNHPASVYVSKINSTIVLHSISSRLI